ncbi:MAG: (2Fe-2S)-binding protein [Actinomycetota bacterium]|nr:(2Fe-2S)-binding protein [Actinomycetota bacterium]
MTTDSAPSTTPRPAADPVKIPAVVRITKRVESEPRLDRAARLLSPAASALLASDRRRDLLHGTWMGHALHPLLTDVAIGSWTSASVLDLIGGPSARGGAQRLLELGLFAAVPTAVTGLAEWGETGDGERRVGVVHATANTVGLALYTSSWVARRRGRHGLGVVLALAGASAATVGGYLGGHLTSARKVSTRHPVFEAETLS